MTVPDGDTADRRDPGLQPERTRLAWRRTALAGTVVSMLAIRLALVHATDTVAVALVGLVALGWLALLVTAQRRIRALAAARPAAMLSRLPVVAVAVVLAVAVLAAIAVLPPNPGP